MGVIQRESASRNDTVDMRVKFELLIPTMQHTEKADLGAQVVWVTGNRKSVSALVRKSKS